jgi:hypothetical protein
MQQTSLLFNHLGGKDSPQQPGYWLAFILLPKIGFLIPIQGGPSQSFIYDRRCGRINYQSGGPAPSSIFRQLSYGKLFEDFFAFSLE